MYPKLTYILISILFLVASCNSDTPDDMSLPKGGELSFKTAALTRGSVATSMNQFFVYGDTKPLTSEDSKPIVIFHKTNVEYKNDKWSYEGTQYWIPNYEHSFVAICPGDIFETGNEPQYLNSQLSFEYSIPVQNGILSSTGDVADILISTHRRFYPIVGSVSDLDNQITMKFSHLLSLINLAPAYYDNKLSSDSYIMIHKLELSGVKTKSQFNIKPAPRLSDNQTDDMIIDENPQVESNISIQLPSPVKIENNAENVSIFAADDALIMLPQTFTADSDAKITLSYTENGESTMRQVSLHLNKLKWERGTSYSYKFTIEKTGVQFETCEINPWNVINNDEITVD